MVKVTGCVRWACVAVAVSAFVSAANVRAETLEEVEKNIVAAWEKATSASYDMESLTDSSGPGYSIKATTTAKCEMMRDGGKLKMHMDSVSANEQAFGTTVNKTESKSSMIVDGDFAYTIMDNAGQKMAMKMDGKAYSANAGGAQMFKSLAESNTLTLQPDETVDGQAAYVIDSKANVGGSTMRYYFAKDTGWTIQMISKGPDGKVVSTTKIKNIKLGASIPADHFVFTAPAGVTVQDLTKK